MPEAKKDGYQWQIERDFEPWLDPVLRSEGTVVKESPAKLVTKHAAGGRTFYVKRYRTLAFRPFKYFFKSSYAREEWRLAHKLEAMRVPVVKHLALGERWGLAGLQETVLITEGFPGVPLYERLDAHLEPLLALVTHMHACGVLQKDLHPGNILVHPESGEMRLVDLKGTVLKPSLSPQEKMENLAFLRIFVPIAVSHEIRQLSEAMRRTFLARRSGRCLKHNREFGPVPAGRWIWQVRKPFLNDGLLKILSDPDMFLAGESEILKPGRSSTVGRGRGVVVKRFNFRKKLNLLKDLFRASRARRAFRKAYHLELVGVSTARPLAMTDERSFGFLRRSYLITEELQGASRLSAWTGDKRMALRAVAALLAKLHEEGFTHRDLKESNLLVDAAGRAFVVDLDGLSGPGKVPDERAVSDLARLARTIGTPGWKQCFSVFDRARFVSHYGRERGRSDWRWWWQQIAQLAAPASGAAQRPINQPARSVAEQSRAGGVRP